MIRTHALMGSISANLHEFLHSIDTAGIPAGVRCQKMPKQSPNLNAYAESWVRSIKRECLDKMILFGERHVRHVIDEYVEHYNHERPH